MALMVSSSLMCFMCVHSFRLILGFAYLFSFLFSFLHLL